MIGRGSIDDLRDDRILHFALLLSFLLGIAWIWFRTPNFAAPDEYSRILDPLKVAGRTAADPSVESVITAVSEGRALGVTFYLYGVALVPVAVIVLLTGSFGELAAAAAIQSRWELWHAVPDWFWTAAIVAARFTSIMALVLTTYLVYRIGCEIYDESTAGYASLLFAVTFGAISLAHEAAEDAPTMLTVTLVLFLSIRYIHSDRPRLLYLGSAIGGLGIALKFSGAISVVVLGLAFSFGELGEDRIGRFDRESARILGINILLGLFGMYVGFPSVVMGGPTVFLERLVNEASRHVIGTAGSGIPPPFLGYEYLWALLNGVGIPLTIGGAFGVSQYARKLVFGDRPCDAETILLMTLLLFSLVFVLTSNVETSYLLPIYPILALFATKALLNLDTRFSVSGKAVFFVLLLTTALYTGVGMAAYANEPRDRAAAWIDENVAASDSMVVYENSIADVAPPHGYRVEHYPFDESRSKSESLLANESDFTAWMMESAGESTDYIQLTCSKEIMYLTEGPGEQFPVRAAYIRSLVSESDGPFSVIERFGTDPSRYVSQRNDEIGSLLWAGVVPKPQNTEPCILILGR